jgi:2-methylisocitrate lyase-like PEP mutase family enzyme
MLELPDDRRILAGNSMAVSQHDKAVRFRALHAAPGAFVIPNPWDAGSASLLASLGFPALATSSYAAAGTLGRRDGDVTRDEALAMAREIVAVTDLPVSADLENGFGDSVSVVRETIRLAAGAGLAGCSIEDAPAEAPAYDLGLATERIAGAAEAARALSFPFVLTARAENFARGKPDLDDTIRRLQAYERAGADVLFAPGLPDLASVRAVCSAVTKPVNVVAGTKGRPFTVEQLAAAGVKRISLAISLYRAAMTALRDAAQEVREHGTFNFAERAMPSAEITAVMVDRSAKRNA